jgi:uncharacterized protein (UPF0548 family)
MIFLFKPTAQKIQRFLRGQQSRKLTYAAVGETFGNPPVGFKIIHTRVLLGSGESVFDLARAALCRWDQFHLGWIEAGPTETPIATGEVVAITTRVAGIWWLNACRIVKVVDDDGTIRRFGFAYGTLPCHVSRGEERFLIEWNRKDDSVWYDILSFSRPNYLFAKVGYPLVRLMQHRFGRDSAMAMQQTILAAAARNGIEH